MARAVCAARAIGATTVLIVCVFYVYDINAFRAFDVRLDTGSRPAPPSPPRRPAPRLSSPRLRRTDRCGTRVRPRLRT